MAETKYRRLRQNEIIRSGDQFYNGGDEWLITMNPGHKVTHIGLPYRRPLTLRKVAKTPRKQSARLARPKGSPNKLKAAIALVRKEALRIGYSPSGSFVRDLKSFERRAAV